MNWAERSDEALWSLFTLGQSIWLFVMNWDERVNVTPGILCRVPKKDLIRVRAYIAASEWQFAKTMPQWPHWYVVRDWGRKREFDFFAKLIDRNGYIDLWGRNSWKYLVVDDFKYWICEDVLNRAKRRSNAWIIKQAKKYVAKHGRGRAWPVR